jgi:hypothetical protein
MFMQQRNDCNVRQVTRGCCDHLAAEIERKSSCVRSGQAFGRGAERIAPEEHGVQGVFVGMPADRGRISG